MSKSWYLLYSKAKQEKTALENLERQGYTAYLPMLEQKKRSKNTMRDVVLPMFPRYLFVSLQQGVDDFAPIRSTIGIANMVRFAGCASVVPDSLITALQQQEAGAEVLEPEFVAGDKVRIATGPFADYEAIFQSSNADARAIILLNIAEKATQMKISLDSIDKVA